MTEKKKGQEIETVEIIEEKKPISTPAVHEAGMQMVPMNQVKKWYKEFTEFTKEILKKDLDYGKIPGTPKPTLLKPGAEKLRFVYGLGVEMKCMSKTERMEDPAFIDYTYKATVSSKSGQILAEAEGSCNSYEAKFKYMWIEKPKPADEIAKKMKADKRGRWRQNAKGAWLWYERTENTEVAGLKNTIMKMSQKRAMVAGILIATGASEFFTQDMEDMVQNTGDITSDKSAAKKPVTTAPVKPAQTVAPTQPAAKPEEKKPEAAAAKPEEKKEPASLAEDPINDVLGNEDATLVIREREVLQEWKELVDKYDDHNKLKKEAEEIVGGCMITGKIDTDKAQFLRVYINRKFKWLKSQADKK